jgi:hypothetical protein
MSDFERLFFCTQCKQGTARFPDQLYVEWSNAETTNREGCDAEMFCSWDCAASWFSAQATLRKTREPA